MQRVDVAIVGGGPAGAAAAYEAAVGGAAAVAIEKGVPRADRDRLGPDSTDAAGMLDYWVDIMGFRPEEIPDEVVLQELEDTEFIGPNERVTLSSTGIESSYPSMGYTFHRARMDDWMRDRAEKAGARYRVGTSVKDVETDLTDGDGVTHTLTLADGDVLETDALILADGPQRTVTNRVLDRFMPDGKSITDYTASTTANHIAYQEHRRFPPELFDEDTLKFWWGVMPGETAYPWVFPNDDGVARVGLTMPIGMELDDVDDPGAYDLLDPQDDRIPRGGEYVHRLLEREYGDEYDVDSDFPLVEDRGKRGGTETYPISSTRPIDSPTAANVAVVGGAMGATSAFHEGGYHVAVRTGRVAGELAAAGRLEEYNDAWKAAIGDEVLRNVTFAQMVREYEPDDWDRAFGVASELVAHNGDAGDVLRLRPSAGLTGLRLFARYKYRKWTNRDGRYVQVPESTYAV
jgi:electron-transferring-flavoprotein dehydrogenase